MRRVLMAVVGIGAIAGATVACGDGNGPAKATSSAARGPRVVASTTWTGAYAKAAGAADVRVIAPADFRHPPDYEPKPSELLAVRQAHFVLVGGIERFVARIKDAAGGHAKVVEVQLANTRDGIRAEVSRLGELFGTQPQAQEFLTRFDAATNG